MISLEPKRSRIKISKRSPGDANVPKIELPIASKTSVTVRAARFAVSVLIALVLLLVPTSAQAQMQSIRKALDPKPNIAATSLTSYLERVRAENSNVQAAPGSIWADSGRLTRMTTDVRAMRPHDLIQVVVAENLTSTMDGTVKNTRASNANSGISGLFGTLKPGNALQNFNYTEFNLRAERAGNQRYGLESKYNIWRSGR